MAASGDARAERTMDVHIIAEDKPLWSGTATSVVVPTMEGYMGILPDHEPVLALVGEGVVTVTTDAQDKETFNVRAGFLSFEENTLTVGVDETF